MAGFKLLMVSQLAHKILEYLIISRPKRGGDSTESAQPCPRKSPRHTQGEHRFSLLGQKEWLKEAHTVMTKFLHGECGRTGGRGGFGVCQVGDKSSFLHPGLASPRTGGLGGNCVLRAAGQRKSV